MATFVFSIVALALFSNLGGCTSDGTGERQKEKFLQSVKNNPADVYGWINLGISHFQLKEYQRAVRAFKTALKIDPQNTDALYSLGLCYHHMGKHNKAIEQYRRLRLIDRDLSDKLFKVLNNAS